LGSAVSEAAHAAQQMSKEMTKQELQEAGFRNRGDAVSGAVHEAQQAAREREAAAEDSEVESPTGTPSVPSTPRP
jgi:hypothetical protein